jgi:hypothetical protein
LYATTWSAALGWIEDFSTPTLTAVNDVCPSIDPCLERVTCPVMAMAKSKSKGCKAKKCSNWKGGRCRCGRD